MEEKKLDSEGPDPNPYQPAKFDSSWITTVQVIVVKGRQTDRCTDRLADRCL